MVKPIDQLWYTWARTGLDPDLNGAYNIRAASDVLKKYKSPRVKNFYQYLRYERPEGADTNSSPPSLAWIYIRKEEAEKQIPVDQRISKEDEKQIPPDQRIQDEYILVNKVYMGVDKFNRPGTPFAHLLASLPNDFTVRDAILLWRSSFWRSYDTKLDEKDLDLSQTSIEELRSHQLPFDQLDLFKLDYIDSQMLRTYLPYFLSLYFMWRTDYDAWKSKRHQEESPKHFYIAAPADLVAAFLLALTLCLPDVLLEGLTFNTYEKVKHIQVAGQALLVGTTFTDEMLNDRADLPESCYTSDIALKCYYPDRYTSLESYSHGALAFAVAKNITEKLANSKGREKLKNFKARRKFVENTHLVDVAMYLTTYDGVFLKERKSDKPTLEYYLIHQEGAAEYFGDTGIPAFSIRLALEEPYWGATTLAPNLELLAAYSNKERDEELAQALFEIGMLAVNRFIENVSKGKQLSAAPVLVEIMDAFSSLSVPGKSNAWREIWTLPLYSLQHQPKHEFLEFFLANLSVYYRFLKQWARSLTPEEYWLLDGLLQVPWQDSENFFALNLPPACNLDAFYASKNSMPEMLKRAPGPRFTAFITSLLKYYLKEEQNWSHAIDLYKTFEAAPFQYTQSWVQALLDSPLSRGREPALQALITPVNRVWFLQHYGLMYLKNQKAEIINAQFAYIQNNSHDKFAVLDHWFQYKLDWQLMENVLRTAQMQSKEIPTFLETYGAYYLPEYSRMQYGSTFQQTYMYMYIKEYLTTLDEGSLRTSSSTQKFIAFLNQNSATLPRDLQNLLAKFMRFDNAFNKNSDALQLVIDIANALEQRETNRSLLYAKMAKRFVENISDETYLSEVMDTMRDISPPFTRNDMFQILFVIAQLVRGTYTQSKSFSAERVALYVKFALYADVIFVKPTAPIDTQCEPDTYARFQKNFLDRLLERMNADLFKQVEQKLASESQQMLRDYPKERKVINVSHLRLLSLLPQQGMRQEQRTEMADAFVQHISNETYLAEMIRSMQQASFTLDDMFQILFMMAQIVHDEILQESTPELIDRIALYLSFVLHADVIFVRSATKSSATCELYVYKSFQKNFLARLLEGVDTSIRKELAERLSSEDTKKLTTLGHQLRTSSYSKPITATADAQSNSANQAAIKESTLPSFVGMFSSLKRQGNTQQAAIAEANSATESTSFSTEEGGYSAAANIQKRNKKGFGSKVTDRLEVLFNMMVGSGSKKKKLNKPRNQKS